MKSGVVIQARMSSTRLPGKVLMSLAGKSLLLHIVERMKKSAVDEVIIATTDNEIDSAIVEFCKENNIKVFRGSEENVLDRYYACALKNELDVIVRITSDDPFKDYRIVDQGVDLLISNKLDFVCNNHPPSFPEGIDVEVMTMSTLEHMHTNASTDFQKEHVTQFVHQNWSSFKVLNIEDDVDRSNFRWTIDTVKDFTFATMVYDELYEPNPDFTSEDIYDLLERKPELGLINNNEIKSDLYK